MHSLGLSGCGLGQAAAASLSAVLDKCPSLTQLNVRNTGGICGDAAKALAQAAVASSGLVQLSGIPLAALRQNKEPLDLRGLAQGGGLGDVEAHALALALRPDTTVTRIDFGNNRTSFEAASTLAEAAMVGRTSMHTNV